MSDTDRGQGAIPGTTAETPAEPERPALRALRLCTNFRAGQVLPSCGARGADALKAVIEEALAAREQAGNPFPLAFETAHCMGQCHIGPTLRLVPAGPFLMGVKTRQDVDRILDLVTGGRIDEAAADFPLPGRGAAS